MIDKIFEEIRAERIRQHEKWGEQNHPMLPETVKKENLAARLKQIRTFNDESIWSSWYSILGEEVLEAFLEESSVKQREEMVQVAAVAVQIIEYLDRTLKKEAA